MDKFDTTFSKLTENVVAQKSWLWHVAQDLIDGIAEEFDNRPRKTSVEEVKAEIMNLLQSEVDEAFRDFNKVN